jgi:hydroxyacylglutathione hydrolase
MIFEQFVNPDLGCAAYMVGCQAAGEVVLVDPHFAIEPLLAAAKRHEARIVRVLETHTHADHVSGHGRLALDHGIPVSIHPIAAVAYPHDPIVDGEAVRVGNVSLGCLHTPGHRPEHCCFTVTDHTRADEPWLVLTGDSLFVGDTARPDLAVGGVEGAEGLFHSLRRLVELGDGIEVFPGHVSGSLCGKGMSSKPSTTIGFERRFNPMLRFGAVDEFVTVSAGIGAPKPPNLGRIVAANSGPFIGSLAAPQELRAPATDAQLLDVRPFDAFCSGHHAGAVSVPVAGSSFATKAGFVLDPEQPVYLVSSTASEAIRAIEGLRSIAFFDIPGFVLGGGAETLEPVTTDELAYDMSEHRVLVIDVREPDEYADGHVPGSRNVPYRLLRGRSIVPSGRPVVTICESGARAAVGASVLRSHGIDARPVAVGGMTEWRRADHPLETGEPGGDTPNHGERSKRKGNSAPSPTRHTHPT